VWPTLLVALEKLPLAIRKAVPKSVSAKYADPTMRRVLHPVSMLLSAMHPLILARRTQLASILCSGLRHTSSSMHLSRAIPL
jgi:hypothetical protein